jgi:outer membrane receptor protein involved in Fe transport
VARNLDPNFSEYSRNPREYAFYIQDKMEYGDFVLNFGLRLDAFDPNSRVPKDKYKYTPDIYKTPFFDKGYITPADEAEFYKDASVKYQFSPRIGVAYSVTAVTKFHFSYGEFLKMPSMNLLYENSNYRIFPASKYGNLVGNPDIKPERTAAYEVGFSTLISNLASANITAFYKDIRDYVGTSNVPVLWENNSATGYGYFYYTNLDYANVRGITLEVNKLYTDNYSLTLDYTFMVSEGTASNPGEYYSADISGEELNRFIFPLDWDQRHTLNGTFYYNFEGWGISFIGTMSSGQPYTPSFATGYPTGLSSIRYYNKNKGRKPNYYNVDMNLKKGFPIGEYNLTFFVRIYNLFDIQNEVNVYTDTGRATFSTAANKARENEIASGNDEDSSFKRWGTFEEYIKQPQMFSAPRQIQLGLTFNF